MAAIEMRRVDWPDEVRQPGQFAWTILQRDDNGLKLGDRPHWADEVPTHIHMMTPDRARIRLPVNRGEIAVGCWSWDGSQDKPTLGPSISNNGGWHGWVREGRMVDV